MFSQNEFEKLIEFWAPTGDTPEYAIGTLGLLRYILKNKSNEHIREDIKQFIKLHENDPDDLPIHWTSEWIIEL